MFTIGLFIAAGLGLVLLMVGMVADMLIRDWYWARQIRRTKKGS